MQPVLEVEKGRLGEDRENAHTPRLALHSINIHPMQSLKTDLLQGGKRATEPSIMPIQGMSYTMIEKSFLHNKHYSFKCLSKS